MGLELAGCQYNCSDWSERQNKVTKRKTCYFCIYGKYDYDNVLLLISGGYYLALIITFPSQLLSRIKIRVKIIIWHVLEVFVYKIYAAKV